MFNYYQFPSEEIVTKFHYENYDFLSGKDLPGSQKDGFDSLESRTANYTPYELFCFNTKLAHFLSFVNPDLSHSLVPKEYKKEIYLFVQLMYGMNPVPISKELKPTIEELVKKSYELPGKFLFFSAWRKLRINETTIPAFWLRSVIGSASLPEFVNYNSSVIFKTNPLIENNNIYLELDPDTAYNEDYVNLKLSFLNYLYELYDSGVVPVKNKDFVQKWELDYVREDLYKAEWTNVLFAKNKTLFLIGQLAGKPYISFSVVQDEKVRRCISSKLRLTHEFTESSLNVYADNLQDCLKTSSLILECEVNARN
jgi:hypothetical protein